MRLWLLKLMDWLTEKFFDRAIAMERKRLQREHAEYKRKQAEENAHYQPSGRNPLNGKPYGLKQRPRQGKTLNRRKRAVDEHGGL